MMLEVKGKADIPNLPLAAAPFANVILDDGLSTRKAMLVAKTLEDPLRRVALFGFVRGNVLERKRAVS